MPPLFRKVIFALLPVLLLFGGLEGTLYLQDYRGTSIADVQSTAGFQQNAYVQRRDRILGNWFIEKDGIYSSNPYLLMRGFHQQSFQAQPKETRRYFALGGSTTYGSPFEHQAKGFPQRIEERLAQASDDSWEVINLGVAGMDSGSFPDIIEEIINYQPEGIFIYTGNNEIRGALTERCSNPYRVGLEKQINRIRTVQLLRDQFRRFRNVSVQFDRLAERQDDCMKREIEVIQKEQRTQEHQQMVLERFQTNLQESIDIATQNNIAVYLAIPPINLLLPPSDQHWNRGLPKKEESFLQELLHQKPVPWEQVLKLDPSFTLASYQRGMQLQQEGKSSQALQHLRNAVSQDHFSKRITPALQEVIVTLCKENPHIYCIDIDRSFQKAMKGAIPDETLFEDFCHPTFEKGTSLIADQFINALRNDINRIPSSQSIKDEIKIVSPPHQCRMIIGTTYNRLDSIGIFTVLLRLIHIILIFHIQQSSNGSTIFIPWTYRRNDAMHKSKICLYQSRDKYLDNKFVGRLGMKIHTIFWIWIVGIIDPISQLGFKKSL